MNSMQSLLPYKVSHIELLAPSTSLLRLTPASESKILLEPGQYIQIVDHGVASPFSVANACSDGSLLDLHVSHKLHNHTAQAILRLAQEQQQLLLEGPYGSATLDNLSLDNPLIFVIRGTGIAPVKAILEKICLLQVQPKHIHVYWNMVVKEDFYWLDYFADYIASLLPNYLFTPILDNDLCGKPISSVILRDYPAIEEEQIYACGPLAMVKELYHDLLPLGLREDNFYSDMKNYF